jgi:hypothetical protein
MLITDCLEKSPKLYRETAILGKAISVSIILLA